MGCRSCLGACSCSSVPRGMAMVPVRSIALGQDPGPSRVTKRTFTVYAPVLRSPLDLAQQVEKIVETIEASGAWVVTSFSVSSGNEIKLIPLLPRFLQPTVQIMKFIVRRFNDPENRFAGDFGRVAAKAAIFNAALRRAVTLEPVKDWVVEVKEEIVKPTVESLTLPGICDAIKKATGWSCTSLGIVGGGVLVVGVLGWLIVPIVARTVLTVGTESVVRRAIGSHSNASRRRRRSRP